MDEQLSNKILYTLKTLLKVENVEIIHCTLESLIEELEENHYNDDDLRDS